MIELTHISKVYDGPNRVEALKDISLSVKEGEIFGVIGQSGAGKSTLIRCINMLERPTSGSVVVDGVDLTKLNEKDLREQRKNIGMIFQHFNLLSSRTVYDNVAFPLELQGMSKAEIKERILPILDIVKLGDRLNNYPSQLSGGQKQRVGIARALAVKPEFIVCDEPISALDVSIQSQVVNMLEDMQEEMGLTYLFIAHDISVVRHISHRIGVMYLGTMVELAESYELNRHPLHPYTQTLLSAVPVPDPEVSRSRQRIVLEGDIPSPMNPPSGCRFHTRCPYAMDKCKECVPKFKEYEKGHWVACHLLEQ